MIAVWSFSGIPISSKVIKKGEHKFSVSHKTGPVSFFAWRPRGAD